ncbi:hypothetical protein Tco_0862264, partial [Tanacetum coccineum]
GDSDEEYDDEDDFDDDSDESDDERIESNRDEIPDPNKTNEEHNKEEEEYDAEFNIEEDKKINDEETINDDEDDAVTKELYDDVNVNLGNEDTEMTNADLDAHVTPTPVLDTQKTGGLTQSSSVSYDFTSKLLNLDNPSPADNEIASLIDTTTQHATTIPKITSIDRYIDNKLGEAIYKAIQAHNFDCREEAQAEKREYIELVDSTVRTIIKEEVNAQLPQILPQAISDVTTPVIEKNVTKSLEVAILTRSSSQPTSTYEEVATLSEFELTKILIDKMEKNKSYDKADYKKKLYNALVESYNTDKDLFDSYGEVFSLTRSRDKKDKDRDPSAGSDRGTKRRKSSKYVESSRDSSHTVKESVMQQDQEFITGNNNEQPADKEVTKADWFKKPVRPPTPDPDWSKRQQVDFRPPQTWISQVACAEEPPTSFDELNDTSFDFSAFVMNRLKIPNLTQEILVGPAFNLFKGTYKSITELEYHFE